jgi:hypothetical protein
MGFLPNELVVLNDDLSRRTILTRLPTTGAIAGSILKEHHYDDLIVAHQDSVADALRQAGLIAPDSELLHLGKILAIDVLFAEVETGTDTFRRFVIAEDKLWRNPEARREVLGQILDYARALKELDPDGLTELLADDKAPWVDANDDLVRVALREADFLLLVCGDVIHPRLIDYVDHLKDLLDPLAAVELALVSLAIFSDGTDHVLVPHVVGAIVKAERPVTIRVVVTGEAGAVVPASVAVDIRPPSEPRRRIIALDELLEQISSIAPEARATAERLLEGAMQFGAEVSLRAAAASVRIKNKSTGSPCTLFVITRRGTFYTGFVRRWEKNAGVGPELARDLDETLTRILGRSPRMAKGDAAGTKAISLVLVGKHTEAILAAMQRVAVVLRDSRRVAEDGTAGA